MKRFQLAVKDFALPVPRSGSIESHSGYGILSQSAEEAHRRVQKARSEANPLYRTEVRVSHSFERDGYVFVVSGRMDGVVDSKPAHIEEIKTAFDARELYEKLKVQPDHPYCLQVKTYAYMWSIQNATVPSCSIYIASYADSDSASSSIGAPRQLSFTGDVTGQFELPILLQVDAYERWLDLRLNELVAEARQYEDDQQRRMQIAAGLQFPFSKARMGQMDLVDKIERVLLSGDALLVQAPTGMGKTAAVVYPMLKEALGRGDRLVYVTPKNSQHRVAEDALERLQSTIAANNRAPDDTDTPELRYLTLSAKSKVCFKGEPVCNPEHCEFARDYYGKVHTNNLVDLAAQESAMDAEVFMLLGKQFEVCPFELSVDAIKRADVVIGDYNYVFSPVSLLGRLTTSAFGTYSKPNLIIDEAHNLPARACDYFSPRLSSQSLDACNECFESLPLDVRMQARGIVRECFALLASFQPKGREKQCVVRPEKASFAKLNQALGSMLNQYLLVRKEPKPGDPFINLCREWSDFTDAVEYEGEEFFCTFLVDSYGLSLRITCCDPSQHLASCLKEFEHTVAFSATMKPFDYYRQLCGFAEDKTESVEFSSPFPRENRKLIVIPQVSTRYSDRAQNYDKIAEAITRIINVHKGNYFVFFPSFAFLREVFDRTQLPGFDVVQQRQNMTSAEVHKLVDSLHEQKTPTVIFAVQGGVFSEGIDYMGDSLIGALIVGPALPGFDLEREKMREYYERRFGQGFDYAYTYPAMARVIQAAGRVIRSETDRGIVVLLDKRFVSPAYTSTMPADWFQNSVGELVSKSILADIKDFWGMEH